MKTETALVQCELQNQNLRPEVKVAGKEAAQLIASKGLSFYEAMIALEYAEALLRDSVISPQLVSE